MNYDDLVDDLMRYWDQGGNKQTIFSMAKRLAGPGGRMLNLSKPDKETAVMTQVMGQNRHSQNTPDIIKAPPSIEKGDILLLTNMGVCNPREPINKRIRDGVSEHYLSARRICQVKI